MVTLNMILDHLSSSTAISLPLRKSHQFRRISLISSQDTPRCRNDIKRPSMSELGESTLYCGRTSTIAPFLTQHCETFGLCVKTPEESVPRTLRALQARVVIVETKETLFTVYEELQSLFFTVDSWITDMKTALLEGGDYQSLLNCTESVIKNFIIVSNSEFRLLAYSPNTPIDDPVTQAIIAQGFHPPETIALFKKYNVTKDWETQSKIELKQASELTRYCVLDYVFRIQGNYFLHVNMHCNLTPPTAGLIDWFQMLIDHIGYCVRHDWSEHYLLEKEPSKLFGDLISHKPFSEKELTERLRDASIPREGSFVLLAFQFTTETSGNPLLSYYMRHLKESFPWCSVGLQRNLVVVLDQEGKLPDVNRSQLQSFINTHPCSIGVSRPFSCIVDFPFAWQQARRAIELATTPRQSLAACYAEHPALPLYRFDEYFSSYVAETARTNNHLIEYCVQNGIVPRIAAFDEQHKTNDLKLLYFYLAYERKVSTTCNALYLHRNTLLYRIEKMQERFDFDLEDMNTRSQLMLEYLLYPEKRA